MVCRCNAPFPVLRTLGFLLWTSFYREPICFRSSRFRWRSTHSLETNLGSGNFPIQSSDRKTGSETQLIIFRIPGGCLPQPSCSPIVSMQLQGPPVDRLSRQRTRPYFNIHRSTSHATTHIFECRLRQREKNINTATCPVNVTLACSQSVK